MSPLFCQCLSNCICDWNFNFILNKSEALLKSVSKPNIWTRVEILSSIFVFFYQQTDTSTLSQTASVVCWEFISLGVFFFRRLRLKYHSPFISWYLKMYDGHAKETFFLSETCKNSVLFAMWSSLRLDIVKKNADTNTSINFWTLMAVPEWNNFIAKRQSHCTLLPSKDEALQRPGSS